MNCKHHDIETPCHECSFDDYAPSLYNPELEGLLDSAKHMLNNVEDTPSPRQVGHQLRAIDSLLCDILRYLIEEETNNEANTMSEVQKTEGGGK